MNTKINEWIKVLVTCEQGSEAVATVWAEAEEFELADQLSSELGRLASLAGAISDAVRPDYVMSAWRVSVWCNPRHKRLLRGRAIPMQYTI